MTQDKGFDDVFSLSTTNSRRIQNVRNVRLGERGGENVNTFRYKNASETSNEMSFELIFFRQFDSTDGCAAHPMTEYIVSLTLYSLHTHISVVRCARILYQLVDLY